MVYKGVPNLFLKMASEEYKGFHISGLVKAVSAKKITALGIVCKPVTRRTIVEVKRIEGQTFENSKEEAERHALELCKEWVDKQATRLPVAVRSRGYSW